MLADGADASPTLPARSSIRTWCGGRTGGGGRGGATSAHRQRAACKPALAEGQGILVRDDDPLAGKEHAAQNARGGPLPRTRRVSCSRPPQSRAGTTPARTRTDRVGRAFRAVTPWLAGASAADRRSRRLRHEPRESVVLVGGEFSTDAAVAGKDDERIRVGLGGDRLGCGFERRGGEYHDVPLVATGDHVDGSHTNVCSRRWQKKG